MSTPTTSTLSSTLTLNTTGAPRPTDVTSLGRRAEPDNANLGNRHVTPVTAQVTVGQIKPVDRRTIEGSYDGKTSNKSDRDLNVVNMDAFKNPQGPRDPVRQSQVVSSKLTDGKVPVPVTGESDSAGTIDG